MSLIPSIESIDRLMRAHHYQQAEEMIQLLLDEGEHDLLLFTALARCLLAQEKFEEALHNYTHLLQHADELDNLSGLEASLVLDKTEESLQFAAAGAQEHANNPEFHFLAALVHYKHGHIKSAGASLRKSILLDFEWDDDDPIDFVTQQILPIREFHDFEQIYIDGLEREHENGKAQNRWFSLNMPTWDLLKASTPELKRKRAVELAGLLSPHFDETYLQNGKSELWRIVNDMNKNEQNDVFVEKARDAIRSNKLIETAKLVLSLQLEHLEQFAPFFGLHPTEIKKTELQHLLVLLPMRPAIALIFLYSTSHTEKNILDYNVSKFPDDILAGLIAACFVSFYQQVDRFRPQESAKNAHAK